MLVCYVIVAYREGIALNMYNMFIKKAYILAIGYMLLLLITHTISDSRLIAVMFKMALFSAGYLSIYWILAREDVVQLLSLLKKTISAKYI
jgi:hypothetical protein